MKLRTILFITCFFLFSGKGVAKISGVFYYSCYQEQSIICFKGTNVSGKVLRDLKVKCVNRVLGQQQEFTLKTVAPGSFFIIGPGRNWIWQPGEKLYIGGPDGRTMCWECKLNPLIGPARSEKAVDHTSVEIEIEQLRYKIRDAERSLREYERMNARNPSVTGMMLVMEQMKLIQTYRERLYTLIQRLHD